jgi:hypothetical protein
VTKLEELSDPYLIDLAYVRARLADGRLPDRVLDFIGAPDVQMELAGRLWGECCICGKELADPFYRASRTSPDEDEFRDEDAPAP